MRWLADFVYLLAGLLYLPFALYQALALKKNRHGWRERFGGVPRFAPERPRVWIHAVSLGEVNCTPSLVKGLAESRPDVEVVVSSTTDTGCARATQLYGAQRVFRFPLDFSVAINRALDRIRPTLIVLVELEVWYNLVHQAHRRGIPVAVVNGRLTPRSARRLAWLGGLARSMFERLTWVGAQDRAIAVRFLALGTSKDRVEVTSSLKWDTAAVTDDVPGMESLRAALRIDPRVPLWVCGSTGPGEEEILLDAYRMLLENGQNLRLVIVPRKPERFDEVSRLIEAQGLRCLRRTQCPDSATRTADGSNPVLMGGAAEDLKAQKENRAGQAADSVILGDTLGELRKIYALAAIVFVGRSLVPMGGSDPIEVAALAKPMLCGPHMENFQEPVSALSAVGAIRTVTDAAQLCREIDSLMRSSADAVAFGQRGREVVLAQQGATARTVQRLTAILGGAAE
ncbi:MAG: 3-deoxy-D-manno-octulosonic acid transferase [Phycisphaerales bacterium]|nr:3-deoxy-D-manno-octulosonic acid transferase [Phycisphaerales bacterium]